jgi:hypothetical protein
MKNFVAKLHALLKPRAPGRKVDWRAIEATLGLQLPPDFKEFWDVFPAGCLGFRDLDSSLLVLHGPGGSSEYTKFPDCVRVMSDVYMDLRSQFPEMHPHRLWPENSGLIGFAHDTNGVEYFLRPVDWQIQTRGDGEDAHIEYTFSEFLWELAHNRVLIAEAFQGAPNDCSLAVWTKES